MCFSKPPKFREAFFVADGNALSDSFQMQKRT